MNLVRIRSCILAHQRPTFSTYVYVARIIQSPLILSAVMALKVAANKVLEITREVVASKESEASFKEKMELLRRSVRAIALHRYH